MAGAAAATRTWAAQPARVSVECSTRSVIILLWHKMSHPQVASLQLLVAWQSPGWSRLVYWPIISPHLTTDNPRCRSCPRSMACRSCWWAGRAWSPPTTRAAWPTWAWWRSPAQCSAQATSGAGNRYWPIRSLHYIAIDQSEAYLFTIVHHVHCWTKYSPYRSAGHQLGGMEEVEVGDWWTTLPVRY